MLSPAPSQMLNDLHIIACSGNIGSLLRFVQRKDKEFRMMVGFINDTVFFIRCEKSPDEIIEEKTG